MANHHLAFNRALRIAVVDDHQACRSEVCRLLERRGFSTSSFASVAAFVASHEKLRIDCLLLDVCMPDIDGIALHTCLKQTNFDFPVVFCTGQEIDERLERALASGAFAVLKKPLRADALVEVIHAACAPRAVPTRSAGEASISPPLQPGTRAGGRTA